MKIQLGHPGWYFVGGVGQFLRLPVSLCRLTIKSHSRRSPQTQSTYAWKTHWDSVFVALSPSPSQGITWQHSKHGPPQLA